MPLPAPEKLYFYCSAADAIEVLSSCTVPWITPSAFDGVTELNPNSQLNFDKEQLVQSTVKIACSLIFGPEAPKGNSPLVNAICRWRDSQRFANAEEAQQVLKELSGKLVDQRLELLNESLAHWAESCSKFHILRLFESADKVPIWDKYGHGFQGVAVELLVGEDTTLEKPTATKYQEYLPEITSLKQQISGLVYGVDIAPDKHLEKRFINRPTCYKSEKEWRCFLNTANSDQGDPTNTLHTLKESEIKAIHLGPAISAEDKDQILSALHQSKCQPRIRQTSFSKGRFELHHHDIETS